MDYSIEGQVDAAQARLQVGERAAGRDPERDAAGPGQAAQELPGPGPVRARGQRLGDHHLDHQADRGPHPGPGAAHRARGAARGVPGGAPPRARHRRDPAGRRRPVGRRDQRQDPVAERRPRAAAREVQGRPPRGPEGPGAGPAAAQGQGRARRPDRGEPARRVPPAAAQGDGAQVRDRRPQGPRRRPEPQDDRARVAQEAGRLGGRALQRAAAEAERDEHRGLDPEQQRATARPRGGAEHAGVAAQAPGRARGPAGRAAAGRGLRAAARRARQHAQGCRRRRAAPAPRAAGGDSPLRQGRRDARDRGVPEPAHRAACSRGAATRVVWCS